MEERSTSDLHEMLMAESNIDDYIKENETDFVSQSLSELLVRIFRKKGISKVELARRAAMSEVYVRQILSGRRYPSRDRLLCLCVGLDLTLEEVQEMLKRASYAQLYPKVKRDAIIEYGIVHHMDLDQINDKLFDEDEGTLF